MCRALLVGLFAALATASLLGAADEPREPPDEPVMVTAKLVGILPRQTRNYVIGVRFLTEDSPPEEIIIEYPAGQSNGPHRYTLKSVLEACIPPDAYGQKDWAEPAMDAKFSIPQHGIGARGEGIEHITVLSLGLKRK